MSGADEVAAVDTAISELDATIAPDARTCSFALILDEWLSFHASIARLDEAVRQPLAKGAAAVLASAQEVMHGMSAWKLAGSISHAGEALQRRGGGQ